MTLLRSLVLLAALLLAGLSQAALAQTSALSGDGEMRVALVTRRLVSIETPGGKPLTQLTLPENVFSVALDQGGAVVFVGYGDGVVQAIHGETGETLWIKQYFDQKIVGLSYWSDDLMAADTDGAVVIVNARTGAVRKDSPGAIERPLARSPLGIQLLTREARMAVDEKTLMVFDRAKKIWTPSPVTGNVMEELVKKPTLMTTRMVHTAPPTPRVICTYDSASAEGEVCSTTTYAQAAYKTVSSMEQDRSKARDGAFPWPPPPATTHRVVDGERLRQEGLKTYKDADQNIRRFLKEGGYEDPSYHRLPPPYEGFAMAASIETIRADGSPADPRWGFTNPYDNEADVGFWARLLGRAPKGYYRVVVFALDTGVETDGDPPTQAEAEKWANGGGLSLISLAPSGEAEKFISTPIDPRLYELTILIYEFEKKSPADKAQLIRPKRISVKQHFEKTGLVSALRLMDGAP